MPQVPQHPANVAPQQQGLVAPVAQSNPYVSPNMVLQNTQPVCYKEYTWCQQ